MRIFIPDWAKSTEAVVALGVAMSAWAGALAQTALTTKRLEEKYQLISDEEIAEAKLYYSRLYKEGEYADPEALLAAKHAGVAQKLIEGLGYRSSEPTPTASEDVPLSGEEVVSAVEESLAEAEERVRNIFRDGHPADEQPEEGHSGEETGKEIAAPHSKAPYIISNEEFARNELDYENIILEYFEADDTLLDERKIPVDDQERMVGENALEQFGFKSKDANLVYVRNEDLGIDFEIQRSSGSYEEQMVGFKHSDPKVGRFREGRAT